MLLSDWLLKVADEVEKDPSRWTKGSYARDASGEKTGPMDPSAVCWCSYGFIYRDLLTFEQMDAVHDFLGRSSSSSLIISFNDDIVDPKEFVDWFRRAADLARKNPEKDKLGLG